MASEIDEIWNDCERELQANRKMADNHQAMFEETIGNLAALKLLTDPSVEEAVKN